MSSATLAGQNGTAGGMASWIDCQFDTSVYVGPSSAIADSYNFWQYNNTDLAGAAPASFDNVVTLTNNDPRLLAAADAVTWLNGRAPQLLPNIVQQPQGTIAAPGNPVTFTVSATGIPAPEYQWQKDGTNLDGETGATLSLASVQADDSGDYSVVVSNAVGSMTSSPATLVVGTPVPPTITAPVVSGNGSFRFSFSGTAGQPFRVWASTNLTLAPVTSTWTLVTNGVFGTDPIPVTDPQASDSEQRFYTITVP